MAYAVHIKLEELEKENAEMRKENTELRHIIAAHAGQIERNKNALCQLFGGLYNPTSQKRILKQHLIALLGAGADASDDEASEADESDDDASDDDEQDEAESLEDSCPTTRQGDAHETRIKESEERLRQLEAQIALVEKRQLEKYGFNM